MHEYVGRQIHRPLARYMDASNPPSLPPSIHPLSIYAKLGHRRTKTDTKNRQLYARACLSIYLPSTCLSIYVPIYLSMYVSIYIYIYMHICMHTDMAHTYLPTTYLPTYLPTYIHTYIHVSAYFFSSIFNYELSMNIRIYLYMYVYIHIAVCRRNVCAHGSVGVLCLSSGAYVCRHYHVWLNF